MKLNLRNVLLLSFLTTFVALVISFLVLPENSGYAGLFFMSISPLVFFMFVVWTLILVATTEKKEGFIRLLITFLSTVVLQYLVMIMVMSILSSNDRNYDLDTFFNDSTDLLSDLAVLVFTLSVATTYTLLLRAILIKK